MKNSKLYISLVATALIGLTACKNDLEVLAPGEESVSVYGVLNPNEPTQTIRINKVYLTDGDALVTAQDGNQINYGAGELKVTLQRFMTGSTTPTVTTRNLTKKEIVLTETVVATSNGNFNTNQRIWQTNDKLYNSGEYKLTITNIGTGKVFTAQTLMVDSTKSAGAPPFIFAPITYPVHCGSGTSGYVPETIPGTGTPQTAYVDYSNLTLSNKIRFKSVPNARLYKVIMRFHYIDSLIGSSTPIRNFVDLNFPIQSSTTLTGDESLEVSFKTTEFYDNIADAIPKKTVGTIKNRTAHYIQYIVYACSENMNTFLQVNEPSTTIAQDKPNYTNINGGVGIFASLSKTSLGKELKTVFIDKIADNPTTNFLQFNKNHTIICP